ncbi:cationic amino acid transporter 2, vacuolar-like [Arachis stenosperma]|uniref:cationic amino acid transporter 2, vacuolar-like n=1 Tax=Arachis stenosperma TaxID=217475 RepID=UPI0025AC9391|nr:cationic amino acid transporter 2, vacuolar-like [Arachis stenosperma]
MGSFKFFTRRKQVDSVEVETKGLLAKELTVPHLIAIGVGSAIGAGVYVPVGPITREEAAAEGKEKVGKEDKEEKAARAYDLAALSFLLVGIAAALSSFCYMQNLQVAALLLRVHITIHTYALEKVSSSVQKHMLAEVG